MWAAVSDWWWCVALMLPHCQAASTALKKGCQRSHHPQGLGESSVVHKPMCREFLGFDSTKKRLPGHSLSSSRSTHYSCEPNQAVSVQSCLPCGRDQWNISSCTMLDATAFAMQHQKTAAQQGTSNSNSTTPFRHHTCLPTSLLVRLTD